MQVSIILPFFVKIRFQLHLDLWSLIADVNLRGNGLLLLIGVPRGTVMSVVRAHAVPLVLI